MYEEGVIRFQADHRVAALDPQVHGAVARTLIAWRYRLVETGVVGCAPNRYGGVGFGNLSGRLPPFSGSPGARPFLVTGTQTGGRPFLTLADLCVVTRYDPECNWVESFGLVRPSSESMTHGVLYDAAPAIRFVFHGHSPAIWEQARALGLRTSHPTAGYGTPAMCGEVQRLLRDPEVFRRRVLVMGGHRDGILAFGETAEEAGRALLDLLSRALRIAC
ncbi:MAG: class II aldolase/adducin family protein [Candidatus Methylomirabilia bacterium]